jgi:lysophospholipase L1-like esterase
VAVNSGGRYVALGSSFAAGPGLKPRAPGSPRRAGRSAVNYAHLVADRLGLELTDVTYSGATTQDILAGAPGKPAQLDAVTADTRLVTLTAGGNDVGYVPRLVLTSLPGPLRGLPSARRRAAELADPELTAQREVEMACPRVGRVRMMATGVRERAPHARLLFVEYLTLLPPDPAVPTGALPAEVAIWGRAVAARLGEVTAAAAAAGGAGFVAAGAASRDHHAYSADPWTRHFHLTLRGGAAYHPNAAGMRAVAGLVAAALAAD